MNANHTMGRYPFKILNCNSDYDYSMENIGLRRNVRCHSRFKNLFPYNNVICASCSSNFSYLTQKYEQANNRKSKDKINNISGFTSTSYTPHYASIINIENINTISGFTYTSKHSHYVPPTAASFRRLEETIRQIT